ncbi:uncharacterized protein LOC133769681 [Lepus europaeus]|uniref:uncharacterized protein LOC133769681 n=1 Tax=Lepus europaeus TaxID=9983 RepID=UPI002B46ADE6|nr:uncharacterized protein LOC133769681 [Lepus europaeus]
MLWHQHLLAGPSRAPPFLSHGHTLHLEETLAQPEREESPPPQTLASPKTWAGCYSNQSLPRYPLPVSPAPGRGKPQDGGGVGGVAAKGSGPGGGRGGSGRPRREEEQLGPPSCVVGRGQGTSWGRSRHLFSLCTCCLLAWETWRESKGLEVETGGRCSCRRGSCPGSAPLCRPRSPAPSAHRGRESLSLVCSSLKWEGGITVILTRAHPHGGFGAASPVSLSPSQTPAAQLGQPSPSPSVGRSLPGPRQGGGDGALRAAVALPGTSDLNEPRLSRCPSPSPRRLSGRSSPAQLHGQMPPFKFSSELQPFLAV